MTIEKFRDLVISRYRETDLGALAGVFREVYLQTYPHFDQKFHEPKRFQEILRENTLRDSQVWIAENDREIVGFLALKKNFIDQLYILEKFQNRGLGSFWVKRAQTVYPDFLELYTFACNKKAIAFYQKHGFKIIRRGIAPDEKMPDVLMRWQPQPSAPDG